MRPAVGAAVELGRQGEGHGPGTVAGRLIRREGKGPRPRFRHCDGLPLVGELGIGWPCLRPCPLPSACRPIADNPPSSATILASCRRTKPKARGKGKGKGQPTPAESKGDTQCVPIS